MYCSNCNKKFPVGVTYCDICGNPLQMVNVSTPANNLAQNPGYRQQTVYPILPLSAGTTLGGGRWVINSVLGMGGMGRTYLAKDNSQLGNVVIKEMFIEPALQQNALSVQGYEAHFNKEVENLAKFQTVQGIPRLFSQIIRENQRIYFVMEYITGEELTKLCERQSYPLPYQQVVEYGKTICRLLTAMHSSNPPMLHLDIRPQNLRIRATDNMLMFLDFGAANNVAGLSSATRSFTAGYTAPEEFYGHAEIRSDLYSTAATMYYMLTKRPPQVNNPVTPGSLIQLNRQIPPGIESIILANLQQEPNSRNNSAQEMLNNLDARGFTSVVSCPNCKKVNDKREIYCTGCEQPIVKGWKNCTKCNYNQVPLRGNFCPMCRTQIQ